MGKHVSHVAQVDPDRRKNPLGLHAAPEPLVECCSLREPARIDDLNDPLPGGAFEIQFDFVHHRLEIRTSDGRERVLALSPKSVAAFYRELFSALHEVGIDVQINTKPQELPDPIPLDRDETHASYDPEYANRFWRILQSTEAVSKSFARGS